MAAWTSCKRRIETCEEIWVVCKQARTIGKSPHAWATIDAELINPKPQGLADPVLRLPAKSGFLSVARRGRVPLPGRHLIALSNSWIAGPYFRLTCGARSIRRADFMSATFCLSHFPVGITGRVGVVTGERTRWANAGGRRRVSRGREGVERLRVPFTASRLRVKTSPIDGSAGRVARWRQGGARPFFRRPGQIHAGRPNPRL